MVNFDLSDSNPIGIKNNQEENVKMKMVIILGLESYFHLGQTIWMYIEGLVLFDDKQFFSSQNMICFE